MRLGIRGEGVSEPLGAAVTAGPKRKQTPTVPSGNEGHGSGEADQGSGFGTRGVWTAGVSPLPPPKAFCLGPIGGKFDTGIDFAIGRLIPCL